MNKDAEKSLRAAAKAGGIEMRTEMTVVIETVRLEKGFSHARIAETVGLDRSFVNRTLRFPMSAELDTLLLIAQAVGVSFVVRPRRLRRSNSHSVPSIRNRGPKGAASQQSRQHRDLSRALDKDQKSDGQHENAGRLSYFTAGSSAD